MTADITNLDTKRPLPENGDGGDGGRTNHRLKELERRAQNIENKINGMNITLTEINTKMDEKASKSYVLGWALGTFALAILTLLGHLLIRQF